MYDFLNNENVLLLGWRKQYSRTEIKKTLLPDLAPASAKIKVDEITQDSILKKWKLLFLFFFSWKMGIAYVWIVQFEVLTYIYIVKISQ